MQHFSVSEDDGACQDEGIPKVPDVQLVARVGQAVHAVEDVPGGGGWDESERPPKI